MRGERGKTPSPARSARKQAQEGHWECPRCTMLWPYVTAPQYRATYALVRYCDRTCQTNYTPVAPEDDA